MKYVVGFLIGCVVGAIGFHSWIKGYAPIESGTANCYTDGTMKLRLNAEVNVWENRPKRYITFGTKFYTMSLNRWRPCVPEENRIIEKQPEYLWE